MPASGKKGMSLVELLTTLAIIAILAGISIAAYVWAVPWVKEKLGFIIQFGDPVKKSRPPEAVAARPARAVLITKRGPRRIE